MRSTSTLENFIKFNTIALFFLGLVLCPTTGFSQITTHYADTETHSPPYDPGLGANITTVANPAFAVDGDPTTFATLYSEGATLAGFGDYTGSMELIFPTTLPAGTTSYVKIGYDADVLNALLGGSLGGAVADLLGGVVLGNHYFVVEARNGTTMVLEGNSEDGFETNEMRLIVNSSGDYLLAITPDQSYDRIFIEDGTFAILLGGNNDMQLYDAFYTTGQDPCEPAFATSYSGSGGAIDALGLGDAGITNPAFAIDGDATTFSAMSLGLLTVAGTLSQTIYFKSLSDATDQYHLTIQTDNPALLGLGLLEGVKVEALDGNQVVSTEALSSLLDLELLGLLSNGDTGTISFSPGVPFDRIRVTITSTVQLNLSKTVDIYEAYRSPAAPTIPVASQNIAICEGETATLSATTTNTNELVWYAGEFGGVALATTAYNASYTTGPLTTNPTIIYVATKVIGCDGESSRTPISITVNPTPATPTTTDATQEFCAVDLPTVADLQTNETGITWYDVATSGTALASTDALVDGTIYYATLTDAVTGCESSVRLAVTIALSNAATPTTTATTQEFCAVDVPTVANLQTNETGVTWYDAATAGNLLATTTALVDGGIYYASLGAGTGCESSVRLAITVSINDVATPTTTDTTQVFCLADTPTVADLQTVESGVIWYDAATDGSLVAAATALVDGTTYYASLTDATSGCESSIRLAVNAAVYSVPTAPSVMDNIVEVNHGGTAILQVASPKSYITYTWYDALSGGTLVHTGATFSVTNVVASTFYFVEASITGSCVSATRTPVSILINNNLLPPIVSPPVLTVTEGGSGTFTASDGGNTNPNIEVVWEDATGAEIHTGNSYITDDTLPEGDYTYEVYIRDTDTGQVSSSVTVTLSVILPGTGGGCTVANAQENGTYFLCLACSVEDAANAVDGNPGTYSRFVAPATLTGGVYQDLIFPSSGVAGDTITVKIGSGSSLLDVGILAEVTLESFNGATANGDGINTGAGGLIDLELLPGTNIGEISFVAGATFDRVHIEYRPTVGLLDSGLRIYQAEISYAGPSAITQNLEVCVGETATLSATPAAGTTLTWYDSAIGGSLLASGNTYTTTAQTTAGEVIYYLAITRNGCEDPDRVPVSITVNDAATPTTTDATQEFCAVDLPTIADLQTNETGITWYDAATGGTALVPTDALVDGTIYYAALTDAVTGCESSVRLAVTVVLSNGATPTTTDATQDFCAIELPTVANLQTNETGVTWYDAATGGTVVVTTTALVDGSMYYASLGAGTACESAVRLAITVSINDVATPTTTDTTQEFCLADSPTVADLQTNESGVIWYDAATGGTLVASTTALVDGTIYYATLTDATSGCESSVRLAVETEVYSIPTAPLVVDDNVEVNYGGTATLQVASPESYITYTWYDAATAGTIVHTGSTYSVVNVLADTSYFVEASITGSCVSATRTEVAIVINNGLLPPIVSPPTLTVTEGGSGTFTASFGGNTPTTTLQIVWEDAAGTEINTGNIYTTDPSLPIGSYTYEVYIRDTAGQVSDSVFVILNVVPPGTSGGCTVANAQENGTYFLCLTCSVENPGNAVDGDATTFARFVAPVAALGGGVYQDLIFPSSGVAGDTITVKIGSGSSLLDVGILAEVTLESFNGAIANGDGINTGAGGLIDLELLPGINIGEISFVAGATFDRVHIEYRPTVGLLDSGLQIYQAEISYAGPSAITQNLEVCVGETATLSATPAAGTTLTWYDSAIGGTLLASGNTYTTTAQTTAGEVIYYLAISRGTCEDPDRIPVSITVNDAATPTTTDATQEFCTVDLPTVADLQTNETGITWYDAATGGTAFAATDALVDGTIYYAALTDAVTGCESSVRLAVTVVLSNGATPTTTDATQDFCAIALPTVANLQTNETGVTWYDAATGGAVVPATTALVDGSIYYASLGAGTACESAVRLAITVSINDVATPTTTDTTQEFCLADSPTVADLQTNEPGVIWYDAATGGSLVAAATALVDGTTYYATLTDATSGCESSIRLAVNAAVYAVPTAPLVMDNSVEVNYGGTAILQVDSPESYITYTWYDAATAGTLVHTGSTYSVLNVLADTSYFVEASITGSCVSATRTEVAIVINNNLLPPVVSPPVLTVTVGGSGTYTASNGGNTNPNIEIVWEDAAGNEINIGNIYNTDNTLPIGTYTYEVYIRDTVTGQVSTSVFVILNVVPPGTGGGCTVANSQVNGTYFLCLACSVENAGNAVDGDASTYSRFVAPAAALGGGVYQDLIFPSSGVAGDTITVKIGSGSSLLDVDVLQEVTLESFNGATANGDGGVVDGGLIDLELLPGTNIGEIRFVASAAFDRVHIEYRTVVGLLNSGLRIYQAEISYAGPSAITQNLEVCVGETATLSATPAAGTTLTWYDSAIGGTFLASGNTYTTPVQTTAGEVTYYLAISRGTCEDPDRIPVSIMVNDAATPTTTDATQEFCAVDLPTIADLQTNETGITWYDAATGGTAFAATDALVDATIYYATLTDTVTGCESSVRLAVTVVLSNGATPTTTDTTQDFCAVDLPTVADLQTNETGVTWYDAATNGTVISATTSLTDGSIYYASLGAGTGCESSVRLAVTVSIDDAATPTSTDTTQEFCASDLPTVADLQTNETGITWYDVATGGTVITSTTALVDGNIYYASLTDATSGCESSVRLAITVNVGDAATPTATETTQNFCASDLPTVADLQTNETNITWYDAATGGTVVPATTALVDGSIYYATLTDATSGCESSVRLAITVNLGDTATPTATDTTQEFCAVDLPTVADLQTNETGIIWYDAATGGTLVPATTALVDGSIYYASLTDATSGCESSVRLAITVNLGDAATPTATETTQDFCAADMPTVADLQTNETGITWYDAATGGTVVPTTTALVDGSIYYASLGAGTACESSTRLAITVNVGDTATPTATDTTQDFCASDLPTVADLQTNETSIIWYDAATGGTVVPATTALVDGSIYYATLTDATSGCESSVRLAITVNVGDTATPTATDTTQEFCAVDLPTVADLQTNETGITWYDAATGGTALASTDALVDGTIYYAALTDAVTGCESAVRLAITVIINDAASPTATATTQDFCAVNLPKVADLQTNETSITWYDAATGGTVVPATTALVDGSIYYASLTDATSGCESSVRLAITVTINDAATPTATDTTQDFCAVDLPTVADLQTNETGITWYDAATGGTALASTDALVDGTIYYAALTDAVTGCESSVRLAITVNVGDTATPTATDTTQEFCAVDLPTVADLQTNETGITWYDAATGGTVVPATTALVDGSIYYAALTDATSGCESAVRLAITVNMNDAVTPTATATTQDFCAVDLPTVADLQTNETGITWYDAATGGTVVPATTALVDGSIYYASLTDATSGCESSVRLAITVTINDAATPTATATTQDFCAVDLPTVTDLQTNETGIVWYDTPTGGTVVPATTALVDGSIYYASLTDATSGCESSVRLAITVNVGDAATPTATDTTQDFCAVDLPTVADLQTNETGIVWYDAATGGTVIASTTALVDGSIYYASLTDATSGCESAVRLAITVNINDAATPTATATTQDFCAVDLPTVADLQTNETGIVWYDAATGGTVIASTTALVDGSIYYASLTDATSGCESSVRLAITVNINDAATPTTTATTQDFCAVDLPTVADLQTNETGIVWYDAATGGTVVPATTALVDGSIYYASLGAGTACESSVRLAITVSVGDAATPTATATTQEFCAVDLPTVADLQINETGIVWYDAATGGTVVPATTALVDGSIYYASLTDATSGCESSVRLAITVNINDAATPTATATTQDFCAVDLPTVADLQTNETNITWYDAATGGTVVPETTALIDGSIYYASLTDATSGCKSSVRLEITVNINDAATPTTLDTTQEFCAVDIPTVADLQTNETGIIWYDAAIGGNTVPATTVLVDGMTYYASLTDPTTNCESSVRLEITVILNQNEDASITGDSVDVCALTEITYTTVPGMTNYVWTVTGGDIVDGGGLTDDFITVSWTEVGNASLDVTYIDPSGCTVNTTATLSVTVISCVDLTITKVVDMPTPMIGDNVVFTIQVTNQGQTAFQNVVVTDVLPSGYSFVSAMASIGTYDSFTGIWTIPSLGAMETASLNLTVEVLSSGEYLNIATIDGSDPVDSDLSNNQAEAEVVPICLTVYNEFSPNNDGANDFFRIDCIETYPDNVLKIYNRYGVLVFEKSGYNNDWDGTSNKSTLGDDEVPAATYFYVLELKSENIIKKGWLYLIR